MTYGKGHGDKSVLLMQTEGEVEWFPVKNSKIADFYKEKNVFVTGATGFLGKLLVEKLLRACPDINTIYILVRPKKGEDELSRVDKIYSDPIFGPLKKLQPKFQHKIVIVKGDVSLPGLGLTTSDRKIITEQVNVIFHIAATVRFDEKITTAIAINIRGTRDTLNIAKECKKFDSFVHISTAYTNCNQEEIEEKFYKPTYTADELIEMMENMPEKALVEMTSNIIAGWPNTYTFTKAIAENAVQQHSAGVPTCVFRPAIVMATYKEPLRSWIDNVYGATGVVIGAGTGLLKSIHCKKEKAAEIVPADYVVNAIITSSYQTAIETKIEEPKIYNYVSSVENRINWEVFMRLNALWGEEVPTIRCIWYYALTLNRYSVIHKLYCLFLHFLPAMLMDLGMAVSGNKPIMMNIYKKITKFESVIAHFATNEWKFHNNNTQELWKGLGEGDRKAFPFSMKEMDWDEYHITHCVGLRMNVLKDDLSTIPEARAKWRRFYIAHILFKCIFYILLLKICQILLTKIFNILS